MPPNRSASPNPANSPSLLHEPSVIHATMFVTLDVVHVWTGTKAGGNDPSGMYSRVSGLDPVVTLTVEAG